MTISCDCIAGWSLSPLSPLLGVPLLLRLVGLRVHVHWRLVVQGGVVVAAGVQELHLHSAEMILKLLGVRMGG